MKDITRPQGRDRVRYCPQTMKVFTGEGGRMKQEVIRRTMEAMSNVDFAVAEQIMRIAEQLAETYPASETAESPVFIRNKESNQHFLAPKKALAPEVQWHF